MNVFKELAVFKNALGDLRVVFEENGDSWFLAADITRALGYKNGTDAIKDHVDEEDRKPLKYKETSKTLVSKIWEMGTFRDKVLVNEAGMYALIFGSKLESAKAFKRWVTGTVLPSIRKNGGYIMGQENLSEAEQNAVAAELQLKYEHIQEKLAKRTEGWHKAVQARDAFKSQVEAYKKAAKGLGMLADMNRKEAEACRKESIASKKEAKACRKDSDENFDRYSRLVKEVAELEMEVSELKRELEAYRGPVQPKKVVVDNQGFLVSAP